MYVLPSSKEFWSLIIKNTYKCQPYNIDLMEQQTNQTHPSRDLTDLVCQIVELWGEGEALDGDRVAEIAANLYDYNKQTILDAIIYGLNAGLLKGKFYTP